MNEQVRFLSEKPVKTTCPYCGVGCGVLACPDANGGVVIKGDPDHPANFGRLCSKGTNLGDTIHLNERLLAPMIKGEVTDWDSALQNIADRFSRLISEYGPGSVAMYVSGQLMTEDYYVANKFMKGFIGSANIDTNSRLCMSSSVAGHKRAFGSDTVPNCYEDLEMSDLVVLVGSNLAWCHPILYQRLEAVRQTRPDFKMVCIDPRATATARASDLHLAIKPGTDVALFNGLLAYLASNQKLDEAYIKAHVEAADEALNEASLLSLKQIAAVTGVGVKELTEFYRLFGETDKVMSLYSQGVNQSSSGTDKVNAILNCHLLTGRIGKEGCGPLSLTGQPNAMGGREVGGLANQLACHMALERADHRDIVGRFWKSDVIPNKPGLMAVDLFRAIKRGDVKAVWIMATNPVDSLPEADVVKAALAASPLVIVSDISRHTDTVMLGDIILPSTGWGEKTGTVTNSERRISRQMAFLGEPGLAKPDWWQIAEVARRMGFEDAFPYQSVYEIFREYAALSTFENDGNRDFDIGGLAEMSAADYDKLFPVQWPCPKQDQGGFVETERLFADGRFYHDNQKGVAVATPYIPPASSASLDYPMLLNTGRVRDQWHTMTRTAKSDRLMRHIGEPFLEINPFDAALYSIEPAEIVRVKSAHGTVLLRARLTDSVRSGELFAPMHWTDQFAAQARVDSLVQGNCDPISGQPESKITPVAISPFGAVSYGYVLSRARPDIATIRGLSGEDEFYWALYRIDCGFALEMAGCGIGQIDNAWLKALLGLDDVSGYEHVEMVDPEGKRSRRAYFKGDQLQAFIAVGPKPVALSRPFMNESFSRTFATSPDKQALLFGRPAPDQPEKGRIVCSCFNVGELEIKAVIERDELGTVKEVGAACQAGTNCGSCRSEIGRLLEASAKAPVV